MWPLFCLSRKSSALMFSILVEVTGEKKKHCFSLSCKKFTMGKLTERKKEDKGKLFASLSKKCLSKNVLLSLVLTLLSVLSHLYIFQNA